MDYTFAQASNLTASGNLNACSTPTPFPRDHRRRSGNRATPRKKRAHRAPHPQQAHRPRTRNRRRRRRTLRPMRRPARHRGLLRNPLHHHRPQCSRDGVAICRHEQKKPLRPLRPTHRRKSLGRTPRLQRPRQKRMERPRHQARPIARPVRSASNLRTDCLNK